MEKKDRKLFSANEYERGILQLVFLSAGIPVLVVVGFFYCLFSDLVYAYLNSGLADHFLSQFLILSLIILLYYFLFVGIIAYNFVHRLVGAFPRVLRELDERINTNVRTHIRLRKGDYAKELVDRINALIDKLPK